MLENTNLFWVTIVKNAVFEGCMHSELRFWTLVPQYRLGY